jgi:hypothetical protein
MFALVAAIIIFLVKVVAVINDTADFSWFWLAVALFVLHFAFDFALPPLPQRQWRRREPK